MTSSSADGSSPPDDTIARRHAEAMAQLDANPNAGSAFEKLRALKALDPILPLPTTAIEDAQEELARQEKRDARHRRKKTQPEPLRDALSGADVGARPASASPNGSSMLRDASGRHITQPAPLAPAITPMIDADKGAEDVLEELPRARPDAPTAPRVPVVLASESLEGPTAASSAIAQTNEPPHDVAVDATTLEAASAVGETTALSRRPESRRAAGARSAVFVTAAVLCLAALLVGLGVLRTPAAPGEATKPPAAPSVPPQAYSVAPRDPPPVGTAESVSSSATPPPTIAPPIRSGATAPSAPRTAAIPSASTTSAPQATTSPTQVHAVPAPSASSSPFDKFNGNN